MFTVTTKPITVYGKRSRRVIKVSDENQVVGLEEFGSHVLERKVSGLDSPALRVPKPHIARTSTSPLNVSQSPIGKTYARRKIKANLKNSSVKPKLQLLSRQPLSDVMNSPIQHRTRTISDYFSKPKPILGNSVKKSVIALSSSEEDEDTPDASPRKVPHKRVRQIVESDDDYVDNDSEEGSPYSSPIVRRRARMIVISDEEEQRPRASGSRNHPIVDLTEDSPPIPPQPLPKSSAPHSRSQKPTKSGNLFRVQATNCKNKFPSSVTQHRKVSDFKTLYTAFEDLTIDDSPPQLHKANHTSRITSNPVQTFSPLKTRTQRKVTHPVRSSPHGDSALSPPRDHRSKVYKVQKSSPLRASLLPIEEDRKKDVKIVEVKAVPPKSRHAVPAIPSKAPLTFLQLLKPLLAECRQEAAMDFDFFISTFTSDEVFDLEPPPTFHVKIGEATYSEVFGCGNLVLKIVPLRNPEKAGLEKKLSEEELPTQSDITEVEREIITTRALGDFSSGFVKLIR